MTIHEDRCIVKFSTWPKSGTTIKNEGIGGTTYTGTAHNNGYIDLTSGATAFDCTVPSSDALNVPINGIKTNIPHTMEFIIYIDSLANDAVLALSTSWNYYFDIQTNGGGFLFKQGPSTNWTQYVTWSVPIGTFKLGVWYHIQIAWDTSAFDIKPVFKINNVNTSLVKTTVGTITAWAAENIFQMCLSSYPFDGKLALFRFHDRLLSDDELTDNYWVDNWRYTYAKPVPTPPTAEEDTLPTVQPPVSRLPRSTRPNALVDANCTIIIRNADLEDIGEITRFNQWIHTLKLNEVSSWQLDMNTKEFDNYEIDEMTGFMFYRDGELLIDGPILTNGIQQTLQTGVEKTTIIGGCDNAFLTSRICYPVVTGPIFDTTTSNWRFGVKRSAVGISSKIVQESEAGQEYDVPIVLEDADGFVEGNTVSFITPQGVSFDSWHTIKHEYGSTALLPDSPPLLLTIAGVDFSTNTITIGVPQQYPAILTPSLPTGGMLYQTSGGIVDDPAYNGYDTRTGNADSIAKQLVYYNAGRGACSDHFGTRAISHLEVASPTGQGASLTANSRGENLLAQVQAVCLAGGLNFRTRQIKNEIVFETYLGSDLSRNGNLVFSVSGGNLKEYTYSIGPPTSNMVWGCGPTTGPNKEMLPSGNNLSIEQYGRWESWINSSTSEAGNNQAQIAANMVQANNIALAQSIINAQVTLTIQETDQVRYPRDFGIGDKVRVMVGNESIDEIITTIVYSLPAGSGMGAGSALTAALTKSETRQMRMQKATNKLLQQITMA